jgi:hypothetical protein
LGRNSRSAPVGDLTLPENTMNDAIGEVLESSTTEYLVGCHELFQAPAFGSLVRSGTRDAERWIYGLVYNVVTGSEPPGGSPVVLGRGEVRDDRIYQEHPELTEMMRTRLSVLTVGYAQGPTLYQHLPPQPPPLHYSVYPCDAAQVTAFTQELAYFRTILAAQTLPPDELLAASVRQASVARGGGPEFAVKAGRELARLLSEEFERMVGILRQIQPA